MIYRPGDLPWGIYVYYNSIQQLSTSFTFILTPSTSLLRTLVITLTPEIKNLSISTEVFVQICSTITRSNPKWWVQGGMWRTEVSRLSVSYLCLLTCFIPFLTRNLPERSYRSHVLRHPKGNGLRIFGGSELNGWSNPLPWPRHNRSD